MEIALLYEMVVGLPGVNKMIVGMVCRDVSGSIPGSLVW